MSKLSRLEIVNLAEISALKLTNTEIDNLLLDIQTLIDYTDELSAVELGLEAKPVRMVNVLRDDVAKSHETELIHYHAPEMRDGYFVVPRIIT